MSDTAISGEIPLDKLVRPADDVRQGRDRDEVRSIAASMGDPEIGQQQPITVFPADYQDVVDEGTRDELSELFQDGHDFVVHDGLSRLEAADMLGWSTLWSVIVPEPPENEVVARLEANTERLDMSDFEVYSALHDHYQTSEATLSDVGAKIGVSESYMSQVFGLFDAPDFIREAWEADHHPLSTSHALSCRAMLSESSIQEYADVGDLDEDEARQLARDDARLMVDVQESHDLDVSDFRDRCRRCHAETLDQLRDRRSHEEKQADGETRAAERATDHFSQGDHATATCRVCGNPADRKIALDVCQQDYGMISELKANEETLLADDSPEPTPPTDPHDPAQDAENAASFLADVAGVSHQEAADLLDSLVSADHTGTQDHD